MKTLLLLAIVSSSAMAADKLECTIQYSRTTEPMSVEFDGDNFAYLEISDIMATYNCELDTDHSVVREVRYACEDSGWSFTLGIIPNAEGEYVGKLKNKRQGSRAMSNDIRCKGNLPL